MTQHSKPQGWHLKDSFRTECKTNALNANWIITVVGTEITSPINKQRNIKAVSFTIAVHTKMKLNDRERNMKYFDWTQNTEWILVITKARWTWTEQSLSIVPICYLIVGWLRAVTVYAIDSSRIASRLVAYIVLVDSSHYLFRFREVTGIITLNYLVFLGCSLRCLI